MGELDTVSGGTASLQGNPLEQFVILAKESIQYMQNKSVLRVELQRISGLFYIRYPAGYPVSFAGYLARRLHMVYPFFKT